MNCINLPSDIYFIFLGYCNVAEVDIIKNYAKFINKSLCKFVETGQLAKLKAIIAFGIKPNNTLMNYACIGGHLKIIEYLYSINVKANLSTLDLAIICCNSKIIKYLYEKGVKPTPKNLQYVRRPSIVEFFKLHL